MLEITDEQVAAPDAKAEDFAQTIKQLTCRIQLTRELKQQLGRTGPVPTVEQDQRQFVRFNCSARGILYGRQSLPGIYRTTAQYIVLVVNLSRGGLCFWHQDQLFPREQLSLWIESKRRLAIEVKRCRMINQRCYEIGARFV